MAYSFSKVVAADARAMPILKQDAVSFIREHTDCQRSEFLISLTIEEIVTNTIKYGGPWKEGDRVSLELQLEPDRVSCCITDSGREFNPAKVPVESPALKHLKREKGGLGILLVRTLLDGMSYEREQGCNRLTVWLRPTSTKQAD